MTFWVKFSTHSWDFLHAFVHQNFCQLTRNHFNTHQVVCVHFSLFQSTNCTFKVVNYRQQFRRVVYHILHSPLIFFLTSSASKVIKVCLHSQKLSICCFFFSLQFSITLNQGCQRFFCCHFSFFNHFCHFFSYISRFNCFFNNFLFHFLIFFQHFHLLLFVYFLIIQYFTLFYSSYRIFGNFVATDDHRSPLRFICLNCRLVLTATFRDGKPIPYGLFLTEFWI